MKKTISKLLLISTIILSSCGVVNSSSSSSSSSSEQTNNMNNNTNPTNIKNLPADLKKVSDSGISTANNTFAFKLFNNLVKEEKNKSIFISPLSVSTALAMTYNGAKGKTKEDMAKTLEINGIKTEDFNNSYKTIKNFISTKDTDLTLATANSLWLRKGEKLKKSFETTIDSFFDGKVTELDFSDKEAPKTINGWVSEKTEGKIKDLIKNIDPATFLYLINTIYFKGSWTEKFDASFTTDTPFTNIEGIQKDIKMMFRNNSDYEYYQGDKFNAVKLYYAKDKKAYLTVFLPNTDSNLTELYKTLDAKSLEEINKNFENKKINLGLPKFKMEYEKKLNENLKALGMEIAFGSGADFTNLAESNGFISEVKHKSFLEVNEEGSEAAAATSVAITKNAISRPTRFVADRPFFFTITESNSNLILFMGSVLDI
ncbi:MAG: serpin family protein [Candidatus Sericytochromatia bacterium]